MQNSAAHELRHQVEESSSGPDRDPDPNKPALHKNDGRRAKGTAKLRDDVAFLSFSNFQTICFPDFHCTVKKEDKDADSVLLDSARSSFSLALKGNSHFVQYNPFQMKPSVLTFLSV